MLTYAHTTICAAANTQGSAGPLSGLELLPNNAHAAASYDHFGYSVAILVPLSYINTIFNPCLRIVWLFWYHFLLSILFLIHAYV